MLRFWSVVFLTLLPLGGQAAQAQGVSEPLTIQGLDQPYLAGARARAMGGAFVALSGNVDALFRNPAGMARLNTLSVSLGGTANSKEWAESQRWVPNRYYAGSSLYFQNEQNYDEPLDPPDWERTSSAFRFGHAAAAYGTEVAGRKLTFGIAYHQLFDLDDYDRNENVLDPYIGDFRPEPVDRPVQGDSVEAAWSEYERSREGAVYAISPAIAFELFDDLRIGGRFSFLQGSSDDREAHFQKGTFIFRDEAHDYDFYPRKGSEAWNGSSDYSGWTALVGAQFTAKYFNLGLTFNAPTQITRTWSRQGERVDTVGVAHAFSEEGEEEVTLPYALTLGTVLKPHSAIRLSFDYHLQDYGRLEEKGAGGPIPHWGTANGLNVGGEWRALNWLEIRAGYREDPKPFYIQNSGIEDERARGSVYSGGIGLAWQSIQLDLAYEYHTLNYYDRWESNVNYSRERQHYFLLGATWSL